MKMKQGSPRRLRRVIAILGVTMITGCADWQLPFSAPATPPRPVPQEAATPVPTASANTAEAFDTTTQEQRAAAQRKAPGGSSLGRTIVSLGSPAEPGFWLKTPLVTAERQGQVTDPATGQSVAVTLIPIAGPAGAGSRMSLAAMRLLGLPLAALVELEVRADG